MQKTIHKFPLHFDMRNRGQAKIEIPQGSLILSVQIQDGIVCLWALVHPAVENETRTFRCEVTGGEVRDFSNMLHLATIQTGSGLFGGLVFHIFEVLANPATT